MRSLIFASLCLMACAGVQQPKEKLGDAPGALMFNGYTKADVSCYSCHNGDAKGTMRAPGLGDVFSDHSDEQLASAIKDGEGRMPAHKDRLNDAEVGQILAWLHTTFPAEAKPAAPAAAATEAPAPAPAATP